MKPLRRQILYFGRWPTPFVHIELDSVAAGSGCPDDISTNGSVKLSSKSTDMYIYRP